MLPNIRANYVKVRLGGGNGPSSAIAAVKLLYTRDGIMSAVLEVSQRRSTGWRVGASHGSVGIAVRPILVPPYSPPPYMSTINLAH